MDDLDPARAESLEDLAKCLRQVRLRADQPSLRELEDRTKHVSGTLPGTPLKRVPLGRTTLNEVLRGLKFPGKAFLLTFIEACGEDIEADRPWAQAWDRLAPRYLEPVAEELQAGLLPELAVLRRRLAEAEERAAEARRERDEALATVNISNAGRRIRPTQTIMRTVQIGDLSPEQIEEAAEARHTFAIAHDGKLIGILMPVTAELVEFLVEQNMSRVLANIGQAEAAIAKPAKMVPLDQV